MRRNSLDVDGRARRRRFGRRLLLRFRLLALCRRDRLLRRTLGGGLRCSLDGFGGGLGVRGRLRRGGRLRRRSGAHLRKELDRRRIVGALEQELALPVDDAALAARLGAWAALQ